MIRSLPLRPAFLALIASSALLPAQSAPTGRGDDARAELRAELESLRAELRQLKAALGELDVVHGTGKAQTEESRGKDKAKAKAEGKAKRVEIRDDDGHEKIADKARKAARAFVLGGDDDDQPRRLVLRTSGEDGDHDGRAFWVQVDGDDDDGHGKHARHELRLGDGDRHIVVFSDGENSPQVHVLGADGEELDGNDVRVEVHGLGGSIGEHVKAALKAHAEGKAKAKGKARARVETRAKAEREGCGCSCDCCGGEARRVEVRVRTDGDDRDGAGKEKGKVKAKKISLGGDAGMGGLLRLRTADGPQVLDLRADGKRCAPARGGVFQLQGAPVEVRGLQVTPQEPVRVRVRKPAGERRRLISI